MATKRNDPYLTRAAVAKLLRLRDRQGRIRPQSVSDYRQQYRGEGSVAPGVPPFPDPDRYDGRAPLWLRSTIERWDDSRPRGLGKAGRDYEPLTLDDPIVRAVSSARRGSRVAR